MSEVVAEIIITETGQRFTTPFSVELAVGDYTLEATYGGATQTRKTTITEGQITKEDFHFAEVPPTRKGLPSSSDSIPATIKPKPTDEFEETTLTLSLDNPEYVSGDPMALSGKLSFTLDGVPLEGRVVELKQEGAAIGTVITGADGSYLYEHIAPAVDVVTVMNWQAAFGGDV